MDGMSIFDAVYESGRAVGDTDIRNDTMIWRWKDEVYEVPLADLPSPATLYNGYFYELPVEKLRRLAKKKE